MVYFPRHLMIFNCESKRRQLHQVAKKAILVGKESVCTSDGSAFKVGSGALSCDFVVQLHGKKPFTSRMERALFGKFSCHGEDVVVLWFVHALNSDCILSLIEVVNILGMDEIVCSHLENSHPSISPFGMPAKPPCWDDLLWKV